MATALADKAATEWSGESQPMQWRLLAVVIYPGRSRNGEDVEYSLDWLLGVWGGTDLRCRGPVSSVGLRR
jgi:hypothetical protein